MGSEIISVVAFVPTVQCGTTQYWLWNIFYITILLMACSIILLVIYATIKARKQQLIGSSVNLAQLIHSSSSTDTPADQKPSSLVEKFGVLWRNDFHDRVPWWTAVELTLRLVLVAFFSFTITVIEQYTSFLLGIVLLGCEMFHPPIGCVGINGRFCPIFSSFPCLLFGDDFKHWRRWIYLHFTFSPFKDKKMDRPVLLTQTTMLLMSMASSTSRSTSQTSVTLSNSYITYL